ncbi:hypothetical protein, partial [Streptomyces sp. AK04-3B]|uniref:hypothetical protein n=1 Tax=Streptomyces sp. AK04-3B TaxID=3028650 RepID=UPI0029C082C9
MHDRLAASLSRQQHLAQPPGPNAAELPSFANVCNARDDLLAVRNLATRARFPTGPVTGILSLTER